MKRVLDSRDWTWLPDASCYNHNFYRNTSTGEVILEEGDADHTLSYYEATDFKEGNYIGCCYMEEFHIPNDVERKLGEPEYVYEFDSEFC